MGDIHDDLREVMGLLGKATPGPWDWSVNGNIIPVPYGDAEIAAVYSEHEDDRAPANAEAIIAAVAFLRNHGHALLGRPDVNDGPFRTQLDRLKACVYVGHPFDASSRQAKELFAEIQDLACQHGPALLARQEGEDAERWRFFAAHFDKPMMREWLRRGFGLHPDAFTPSITAVVDAARSGGGG